MAERGSVVPVIVLPAFAALLVFGVATLLFSTFIGDKRALALGMGLGWTAFVAGRVVGWLDRPRAYAATLRSALTGAGVGLGFFGFLHAMFADGPGWPYTPYWAILVGAGAGLARGHAPLVRARKWQALAALLAGVAATGVGGFLLYRAILAPFLGGQLLALIGAVYALWALRLLLAFAGEESDGAPGLVGWLKANMLQNAIVVLVLAGYLVFRRDLARALLFFPLIEFGLGVAIFGFVLARLRSRVKREATELASASRARPHEQRVHELREGEYDVVAAPVTRFVESGLGAAEYAATLRAAAALDDARAARALAPLAAHREPPRAPALPMAWGFASVGLKALGLALAAWTLFDRVFRAPLPFSLILPLVMLAFGVYAMQDTARAHHRPWLALGVAGAGTGALFGSFLVFALSVGRLGEVPGFVWSVVALIGLVMLAVPAYSSWRQWQRLQRGATPDARRRTPALEMQLELQKQRRRAATLTSLGAILLLPVPWLADWLVSRNALPPDFPSAFSALLAVVVWGIAGFLGAALLRFYGVTRARPAVLAREKQKRARRLAVHEQVMTNLERM